MTIMQLLAGLVSLANLFFQAQRDGQTKRFTLALERIKQLEQATNEELEKAAAAHDSARADPNAGRM